VSVRDPQLCQLTPHTVEELWQMYMQGFAACFVEALGNPLSPAGLRLVSSLPPTRLSP